ncbi:methylated-DNA--[protein]-cysteine S-methyltransferase [Pseudenhygromyxa sp. WMMC2535]|uniref:methylated-DNA--[protein]-cysteine S-methyltransferase n=1 Tax=Pseudenhygromyxa sp. WMMC2535 TaxID=2712867 RepID=UPI00155484DC|nr:methylated-DNA--[protein]-cysteine S-methyltransferase [Pseudenhygromyxa sp. WMMC2535]NVB40914.1 methylated-DNA--[protein]-cysteine S-methyltransferase [Pseudenhygromyxa sp. WMMC2535]
MTQALLHLDISSPLGDLRIVASQTAITAILLPGFEPLASAPGSRRGCLAAAADQLEAYFAGRRRRFELPLAPAGTSFQREVWAALETIPFGETRSYGELAASLGRPTASRAIGAANGRNPISIVVPCHRVIGADGSLTGYAGGLAAKRWLLEHEGRSFTGALFDGLVSPPAG